MITAAQIMNPKHPLNKPFENWVVSKNTRPGVTPTELMTKRKARAFLAAHPQFHTMQNLAS